MHVAAKFRTVFPDTVRTRPVLCLSLPKSEQYFQNSNDQKQKLVLVLFMLCCITSFRTVFRRHKLHRSRATDKQHGHTGTYFA